MSRIAIIWRKSVYDTNQCPKCGTRLMSPDGVPQNIKQRKLLRRWYCGNCGLFVAMVRPYNGEGQPWEKKGRWGE